MAILSKGIKLSYSSSGTESYTDLTDLLEIPSLGGSVDKVDVTTLADASKKYINGIKDYGDLAFKFNYAKEQFTTLNGLTGSINFKVTLPDTTTATFSGEPSVSLEGVGVGAAMTYTLNVSLDSDIEFGA
mgnify:FL=1